jgi:hypothetical protein
MEYITRLRRGFAKQTSTISTVSNLFEEKFDNNRVAAICEANCIRTTEPRRRNCGSGNATRNAFLFIEEIANKETPSQKLRPNYVRKKLLYLVTRKSNSRNIEARTFLPREKFLLKVKPSE